MGRLKLDLHTHCGEATCIYTPNRDVVKKIVTAVKAKGLDGIGITEHYYKAYGFKVRDIVAEHFNNEILIIPGQEIDKGKLHMAVLYLPGDVTFRFLVHPGYPKVEDWASQIDDTIHGIELRNPTHDDEMDREAIQEAARKHKLILLQNSDAHFLSDVGKYYNEITIEELCARAS
jgi:histidinol phosphatase-like PHP family hydrolase